MSKSSVSRALNLDRQSPHQVITHQFLYTSIKQVQIKRNFHAIAGLHNIIGATDCTHLCIKAPSPDAFPFLNHEQHHSINTFIQLKMRNGL